MINKIIKGKIKGYNNNLIRIKTILREYLYLKKKLFLESFIKVKKNRKIYLKIIGLNKKGIYKFSIREAILERIYLKLLNYYKKKKIIIAKLYNKIRNGFIVIYKKLKFFLPKNELLGKYKLGDNMLFKIKRINVKKRNVVLKVFKSIINKKTFIFKKNKVLKGEIKLYKDTIIVMIEGVKCKIYEKFFRKKNKIVINIFLNKNLKFVFKKFKNNNIYLYPLVEETNIFYKFKYFNEDLKNFYYMIKGKNLTFIKKKEISWLNNFKKKNYYYIKKYNNSLKKIELCFKKKIYNPWLIFSKNYILGSKVFNLKIIKKKGNLFTYKLPLGIFAYSINSLNYGFVKYIDIKKKIVIINIV
ncbi:hypothetical protein ACWNYQ_00565 [Candidatus Vidania fulgoroideorum]